MYVHTSAEMKRKSYGILIELENYKESGNI